MTGIQGMQAGDARPANTSAAHVQVLRALEAEAIWAIRETLAAFNNPVLLYSIGKDSTVLLRLAQKAFAPATIPFPVMHIDTGWKFREMISFRDRIVAEMGVELIVATNHEARSAGVTPFTHGTDEYTRLMKTVALREALDQHGFDAAIGGARRDEERSRAKERMFSLRESGHSWNPRSQRPEFWRTVNSGLRHGQTMRVFPLSNWTEIDVWRYIQMENLPVVPLYFAAPRTVTAYQGAWVMVDDDRFPLAPDAKVETREVRFRTLGCYPLTGAVASAATSVADILHELHTGDTSERAGRLIDGDGASSMESKKTEGYF